MPEACLTSTYQHLSISTAQHQLLLIEDVPINARCTGNLSISILIFLKRFAGDTFYPWSNSTVQYLYPGLTTTGDPRKPTDSIATLSNEVPPAECQHQMQCCTPKLGGSARTRGTEASMSTQSCTPIMRGSACKQENTSYTEFFEERSEHSCTLTEELQDLLN